ncbi:MAG: hypothetical protein Q9213_000794 [Squamulea squamosa]
MARTHDISNISYHLKDLDAFGDIVTKAAAAAFPNQGKSRYRHVHSLLLSWEEDELGVVSEVQELDEVLTQTYRFRTQQWSIPSLGSHNALAFRLMEFLRDYDNNENLLLVYYGGHGYMNDDRQCIWSCTETVDSPTVQWYGLQTMLEQANSDALLLLDCCAAASSVAASGNGVTEVIAACGFETWAPGVGEHSFTRSLIEELKYLGHRPPFSVALLHNKVLSRIKYWKPRFASACASETERRKTPIYIQLANEMNRRSIEVRPQPVHLDSSMAASPPLDISQQPSDNSSGSEDIDMLSGETSQTSVAEVWPDQDFKSPKVLISVALEDDQRLRPNDWHEWLKSIPALAKYMHVQGVYKSDSSVVIGVVPVAVWDLLPRDPAISFVCFVRSDNLLQNTAGPLLPPVSHSPAVYKAVRKFFSGLRRSLPPEDSKKQPAPPDSRSRAQRSLEIERKQHEDSRRALQRRALESHERDLKTRERALEIRALGNRARERDDNKLSPDRYSKWEPLKELPLGRRHKKHPE